MIDALIRFCGIIGSALLGVVVSLMLYTIIGVVFLVVFP